MPSGSTPPGMWLPQGCGPLSWQQLQGLCSGGRATSVLASCVAEAAAAAHTSLPVACRCPLQAATLCRLRSTW